MMTSISNHWQTMSTKVLIFCGYCYCPGDVMASTDSWRQPLVSWKKQFLHWINQPSPKALMHASIFFDMRCIYGDEKLFNQLQETVCNTASGNEIFLANLTAQRSQVNSTHGLFLSILLLVVQGNIKIRLI